MHWHAFPPSLYTKPEKLKNGKPRSKLCNSLGGPKKIIAEKNVIQYTKHNHFD